jgi:hypothetical protein
MDKRHELRSGNVGGIIEEENQVDEEEEALRNTSPSPSMFLSLAMAR